MATVQEAIRRMTIVTDERGTTETARKLQDLSKAQDAVTVSEQRKERAQQSAARSLDSIQRQYDKTYAAQQRLQKIETDLNRARAQGLVSIDRQRELMRLATAQISGASAANDNFSRATAAANLALGRMGVSITPGMGALAGLGAALGAAALAFHAASSAAGKFADDMGKVYDVAQIIGLTTSQLQAINDKGSEFALTEEKISTALQRFTSQLEQAHRGEGELFQQLQRVDPALAIRLARTNDNAEALEVYAAALNKASTAERAGLARAGLGRTGFDVGLLLSQIGKEGGIGALTDEFRKSGDAIDKEMIERVRKIKREIDDMAGDAERNFASIFSVGLLEAQFKFYETWRDISRIAKEFSLSAEWPLFVAGLKAVANIVPGGSLLSLLPRGGTKVTVGPGGSSVPLPMARPDAAPTSSEAFAQNAQLELNLYKQKIAVLGEAATAAERLKLKQLELNAAVAQNAELTPLATRAQEALKQSYNVQQLQAMVSALGSGATVTEKYNLAVAQLGIQLKQGEISQTTFNRAVENLDQDRVVQGMRDTISALGTAATDTQRYELRVAELKEMLDQGRISQETFNRALVAANPIFTELQQQATSFATTFVQGMFEGKSAADALVGALDNLEQVLVNAGTNNILTGLVSGNLVQAGVGAAQLGAAYAVEIFTGQSKAAKQAAEDLQKSKEAWETMRDDFGSFFEAQPAEKADSGAPEIKLAKNLSAPTSFKPSPDNTGDWHDRSQYDRAA